MLWIAIAECKIKVLHKTNKMQSGYLFDHANRIDFSCKQANTKRERSYWYFIYPSTAVYLVTNMMVQGDNVDFVWLQLFSLDIHQRYIYKVFLGFVLVIVCRSTKLKLVGTLADSFWSHLCLFVCLFDRKCIFSDEYLFIYNTRIAFALGMCEREKEWRKNSIFRSEFILNEQTRIFVEYVCVVCARVCRGAISKGQTIFGNFQAQTKHEMK